MVNLSRTEENLEISLKSLQKNHKENSVKIIRDADRIDDNGRKLKTIIKQRRLNEVIRLCFHEYCNESSVHGLKYISDSDRPYWDRGIWLGILLISLYGSYVLIYNMWLKWQLSPVIVTFNEKLTSISQIPFPAVTICPETKSKSKFLNFTQSYSKLYRTLDKTGYFNRSKDMSLEEFNYLSAVLQVCESYLMDEFNFPNQMHSSVPVIDLIEKLAPEFNRTYAFCKWRNTVTRCDVHFTKTVTEDGICYTFNNLDPSELYREITVQYKQSAKPRGHNYSQWSLEDGYNEKYKNVSYPQRVLAAGARGGFFIALQGFNYDIDYFCRGPIQGFKVLLHSPDDIPQVSKHYIRIPFEQEVLVSVIPNMITTSEELKHYEPHKRQCFFNNERYLKFFKVYTQNNCNLECLANYTLNKCGCVKFSMPRTFETPVCDISNITCYDHAEDDLLRNEFEDELEAMKTNIPNQKLTKCDCLPACTSLSYNTEISQAFFDLENLVKAYNSSYIEDNPGVKMCRLSVFFKEHQFITSKRSELFGMTDFIASCGGLLGLFMGVSVLSFFEIIYFLTVRLFVWIRKYKSAINEEFIFDANSVNVP